MWSGFLQDVQVMGILKQVEKWLYNNLRSKLLSLLSILISIESLGMTDLCYFTPHGYSVNSEVHKILFHSYVPDKRLDLKHENGTIKRNALLFHTGHKFQQVNPTAWLSKMQKHLTEASRITRRENTVH